MALEGTEVDHSSNHMHFSELEGQPRLDAQLAAYEYLFFLMARWSADRRGQTPQQFSDSNDLGTSKLLLYPYLFATANGHSKDLFALLGPFRAQHDGPIPDRLLRDVLNPGAHFNYFRPDYQVPVAEKQFGLQIKAQEGLNQLTWESLRDLILNIEVGPARFREIFVKADQSDGETYLPRAEFAHKALESSLNSIQYTDPNFIELSSSGLSRICKYSRAYRYYFEYEPNSEMQFERIQRDRKAYVPVAA